MAHSNKHTHTHSYKDGGGSLLNKENSGTKCEDLILCQKDCVFDVCASRSGWTIENTVKGICPNFNASAGAALGLIYDCITISVCAFDALL